MTCEIAVSLSRPAEKEARNAIGRRLAWSVISVVRFEWQLFLNVEQFTLRSSSKKHHLWSGFFANGIEDTTIAFGDLYPELRRIWVVQIRNWLGFFHKFSQHSAKFAHRMRFNEGARILGLQCDLSDPHRGNATVIRVHFADGETWFYKPRSAYQTKTWFNLLAQLNRRGFSRCFKIPRIFPARGHHWMEEIRGSPCATSRQEHDFWFRAGALLYLIHCFSGVDFHAGNIVCAGDQPIFVDCETLFHPETPLPRGVHATEKGLFRTGMLPLEIGSGESIAGLGSITVSRMSSGRVVSSEFCAHAAIQGFENMHRFVRQKPNRLIDSLRTAGRSGTSRCRLLYGPTAYYHSVLQSSCSPALLKKTASRWAFLRQACRRPHITDSIAQREAAALRDFDIPFFVGRVTRRSKPLSARDVRDATQLIARSLSGAQKTLNRVAADQ
jgi:lantibiotic modifying enzyme